MEYAPPAQPRVELERLAEVMRRTGLSQSAVYSAVSRDEFPRPLKITAKAVAWVSTEVSDWIASRPRQTAGMQPAARKRAAAAEAA